MGFIPGKQAIDKSIVSYFQIERGSNKNSLTSKRSRLTQKQYIKRTKETGKDFIAIIFKVKRFRKPNSIAEQ